MEEEEGLGNEKEEVQDEEEKAEVMVCIHAHFFIKRPLFSGWA